MPTVLLFLAAVLVVAGIVALLRAKVIWGILLTLAGLLIGPGATIAFDF